MKKITITLSHLQNPANFERKNPFFQTKRFIAAKRKAVMEFHILRPVREEHELEAPLFSLTGNVILADLRQARAFTVKVNKKLPPEKKLRPGLLNAMGLIDEILHYVAALYREEVKSDAFEQAVSRLEQRLGGEKTQAMLQNFTGQFPPQAVYSGNNSVDGYLNSSEGGESCRSLSLEEIMLLALANLNPAFKPFLFMFDDTVLANQTVYNGAIQELQSFFAELPPFGPDNQSLWDLLRSPALACPDSLFGQLDYMRRRWGLLLSKFMARLLMGLDVIKEEEKPSFFGPGPSEAPTYGYLENEYERFSPDQEWMPRTVLIAKSTLVWLFQLSQKYGREINRLDQIPDEELDELARRGFTGLWLIGLWERSNASRTIKQWTGNPEAAASAYSLYDYDIAGELGGWDALANLRERLFRRGVRLGSDMVPNHTGIDSRWMAEHPDRFLQLPYSPFPYSFNCGNLSGRDDFTVQIEEHYFTRTDAAVVFKRIDNRTGETRFIYHGNDGTSMPWNDTAQIDFLNPEAREAVIQTIVGVCQQFPIVRFDAAMTLAKRHIQRLWYPEPGHGGDIASRSEHAITTDEFNRRIPNEFWREVVDRCASDAPHTLLLAEAFWMMEGYFVRTLGMHRVYNSAFMNMLKNEENAKYRATIKNTMEFDPEILKRFVNFMNNPDEETAVAQFGKDDKYFGICTLLVTMPGLPMFGHGQIEGFEEKYGMEYRRAYKDEQPDGYLVGRHEREIFPLMKRRALFSGSAFFRIYDLYCADNSVNENAFAYSNRAQINGREERALVFYNNSYYETSGWIKMSDPAIPCEDGTRRDSLSEALALHDESQYFTLLREQKSNLWYIRSSKAIGENGFYVGLKGYETQVFLDIYETEDDEKGRWARLHNDLQGSGVSDPQSAIMDIFLGDLYYRFTEIFKPEIITKMQLALSKENSLPAGSALIDESFIETLKAPIEAFIETASRFITGADGAYDPWEPALSADGVIPKFEKVSKVDIWEEYLAFLSRALNLREAAKKRPKAAQLLTDLAEQISKNQWLCAVIIGFGLLSLLRFIIGKNASGKLAGNLAFDHWDLGRKLREQIVRFGASEHDAWRIVDISKVVLGQTAPVIKLRLIQATPEFNASVYAVSIIEENYLDEDFRRVIGINIFDDITWFNKEGFESTLYYATLFHTLESVNVLWPSVNWYDRLERIAEIYSVLSKAEKKSGFRLDKLVDALASNVLTPDTFKTKPAQNKRKK
jgi:glycosidase